MRRTCIVPGTSRDMAIASLIQLAGQYNEPCSAKFGSVRIIVHPGDTSEAVMARTPELSTEGSVHIPAQPLVAELL